MIGLGVMGANLALNIAEQGFPIAVYNRTVETTTKFHANAGSLAGSVVPCASLVELVAAIRPPRPIIIMVTAGGAVDQQIDALHPLLTPDDILIDAGNANFRDTMRRSSQVGGSNPAFMGIGVSGGEEGARHGPSIMAGGTQQSYARVEKVLTAIAAKYQGDACCAWLGNDGAGHFVKTIHNGIEYADMQMIAEIYGILRDGMGMAAKDIAPVFADWNQGRLNSYLIEITATVLAADDPATGKPVVDIILDRAGQKGTGKWTSEMALRYGIPVPTMHAAVDARCLSAMKDQRVAASKQLQGPPATGSAKPAANLADAVRDALYCSKICSYAQGLDLLATADADKKWGLDLGEIARIWKGGCIIRARFLGRIQAAYGKQKRLGNLLLDPELGGFLVQHQAAWRKVTALAAEHGVPTLAMGSSLSYFDSYRRAQLPQNLTQAQRDLFGAHTFERVDKKPGEMFHHEWP